MNERWGWIGRTLWSLLLVLLAHAVVCAQVKQSDKNQPVVAQRVPPATRTVDPVKTPIDLSLPAAMPLGSEKVASFKTAPGWQYVIGTVDVVLPRNGACLVTCGLDVQAHVQTGYLTFRTARRQTGTGTNESDDGWAMDVPVPISQGSATATYTWNMQGGQVYRFGCRTLADRGFLGIDVYPNVSWVCR